MSNYEILSLCIQIIAAIGALTFGLWQIFINKRLAKIEDFVAVAIIPDNGVIKLLNTGKVNLYIHAFEINGRIKKLDKGRLISSASLESSYYWLPIDMVPVGKIFDIKIYLIDEFDKKYLTEGGGESEKIDDKSMKIVVWTNKTIIADWKF